MMEIAWFYGLWFFWFKFQSSSVSTARKAFCQHGEEGRTVKKCAGVFRVKGVNHTLTTARGEGRVNPK